MQSGVKNNFRLILFVMLWIFLMTLFMVTQHCGI